MLDDLSNKFLVASVCNVEHVLSVTLSSFGILIRKVEFHALKPNELIIQVLDRELIVLGDIDELYLSHLQKSFLSTPAYCLE